VTQAHGPRLILNNEEEAFSGNKHTSEYPRASIEAMVTTLRGMGRDIADIFAWLTSWDYRRCGHAGAHRAGGSAAEPAAAAHHRKPAVSTAARLDQMTRTPKILGKAARLAGRVPLIVDAPPRQPHLVLVSQASPFTDYGEPVAVAVLDGHRRSGLVALMFEDGAIAATLLQRQHVSTRSAPSTA